MATNLRKFVNPKFLKTCDLPLMRRLMSRYVSDAGSIDLSVFDQKPDAVRDALRKFFEGPESSYPRALTADLHRIAALGTRRGMRLLLERAKAIGVVLEPSSGSDDITKADPKYVALLSFLHHDEVFLAASDLLALEITTALTELAGEAMDTAPKLDADTKKGFEAAARRLFAADMMGSYCRVGWYEDGDETKIVIVHGIEIAVEWIVDKGKEKVISFRPLGTALISYNPVDGRLKIGGLDKAQRAPMADLFASEMLGKPNFFSRADARDLYTLAPVEKAGFGFQFDHQFDPGIRNVKVFEARADYMPANNSGKRRNAQWSVLVKDRSNALKRMGQATKVSFGPNAYRLVHLGFRVEFESERKPHPKVTVMVKPPETAAFKRELFEGRIMQLLRRNGLCLERQLDQNAVAAE